MNRQDYFNYIEKKLNLLSSQFIARAKLNILDLNIHAETFFAEFLNKLFDYKFQNMNTVAQNIAAIDLKDEVNKIMAQVSLTCTKQKIESSLSKKELQAYQGYRFKFISIAKDAENLRTNNFSNPYNVLFNPAEDIIDIKYLLEIILSTSIDRQKTIYEFLKKELETDINILKLESNLTAVIKILAAENLVKSIESPELNSFQIKNKIMFNGLEKIKDEIDDYKIYFSKLNKIYSEFDKEGANKSFSVLQVIQKTYRDLKTSENRGDKIFNTIIDSIKNKVLNSSNYPQIPVEELEVCVYIVVVDAFIRCKVFENPVGYNYVIT
ncbi:MAG: ABC-three component system protein [Candidatus Adiutrix sp.]